MTKEEKNTAVIGLIPAMYDHDAGISEQIFASGCIHHINGVTETGTGPDAIKASLGELTANFSDSQTELDEVFSVGNRVAVRWTWTGVSRLAGNKWTFHVNSIFHLEEGKIVEYWAIDDRMREMVANGFKLVPPGT